MRILQTSLILTALALTASSSFAQTLVDPNHHTNGIEVGGTLALSEVAYESTDNVRLERKFMVGALSYGIVPGLAIIAQAGVANDGEIKDVVGGQNVDGGDGFIMGIGTKGAFYQYDRLRITGYGMMNYVREDYRDEISGIEFKARTSILEIQGGASAAINMDGTFKPYAALEVVPVSKGSVETRVDGLSNAERLERDDVLNMKIGMVMEFPEGSIRPEATLLGEQTYTLSGIVNL